MLILCTAQGVALPQNPYLPQNCLNLPQKWEGPRVCPSDARPLGTARKGEVAGVRGGTAARRTPVFRRTLKYSCGILLRGLVFENQRQRVGCVSVCSPSEEMSIAVEHGRFLLTAEQLRGDILSPIWGYGKLQFALRASGGSRWA